MTQFRTPRSQSLVIAMAWMVMRRLSRERNIVHWVLPSHVHSCCVWPSHGVSLLFLATAYLHRRSMLRALFCGQSNSYIGITPIIIEDGECQDRRDYFCHR